jgi:hypothetical protein
MTKTIEEMNADFARFENRHISVGGMVALDEYHWIAVENLTYHTDRNELHRIWERFMDLKLTGENNIEHIVLTGQIGHSIAYESITEAHALLHSGIVWLNSIRKEGESGL